MSARRLLTALAPVAFLATGACVATRNDLRLLQNDLAVMRAERAQAEAAQRARQDSILALLVATNDSIAALAQRQVRFQGDVRGELYQLGQQLIQVQELAGQSQRRLQELRASLETRSSQMMSDTAGPGPNTIFQLALDQLRRGSAATARTGFQDLLARHPNSDVADDAQFYIAESFAAEGNAAAADSAYALVVTGYPQSPRAATALYKRGVLLQEGGKTQAARGVYNDVVRLYPRSDEAQLARERLRSLP